MVSRVLSVSRSKTHAFSKETTGFIELVKGLGVKDDAHAGVTVRHRSRVAADPTQPNLRQVHLIHSELFLELGAKGYAIKPGDLGENITTAGIDLLSLPKGAELRIGKAAVVKITGLRNPCKQLDGFCEGLMQAVLDRSPTGDLIRRCGIMGVVLEGGWVSPNDPIEVVLPPEPHEKLERV